MHNLGWIDGACGFWETKTWTQRSEGSKGGGGGGGGAAAGGGAVTVID